jgi:hypothetical protein
MEYTLGEFEQLVLIAIVRLDDDAYGATIRREIDCCVHDPARTSRPRRHQADSSRRGSRMDRR